MALLVVVVVLLAIAFVAKGSATTVLLIVIAAVVVLGAIALMLGKRQTGLSITPEWKPAEVHDDEDDPDDATDVDGATQDGTPEEAEADAEPVRRLDAQILGNDLTKLGQVVNPKLAKSYAMGYLVLTGPDVAWEPSNVSTAQGSERLAVSPAEVSVVERTALWGSWALVRLSTANGTEWCMRVPGSVDLAPAFAELGLTLQQV